MADKIVKRSRKPITLDTKVKIINLSDKGLSSTVIGRRLNLPRTTVHGIIMCKGKILTEVKNLTPVNTTTFRKRDGLIADMEKVLITWIDDQRSHNVPLSQAIIQSKAQSLFDDMKAEKGAAAKDATFGASRGWFERFKRRANLHYIKLQGEVSQDNKISERIEHFDMYKNLSDQLNVKLQGEAAVVMPLDSTEIIDQCGYSKDEIFNVEGIGRVIKQIPSRTFFLKKSDALEWPTEPSNEKRTVLLRARSSGEDRKIDMSSMVSANMTENSMGEIPGPSNEDQPMPLSPEQYLTEEMEPSSTSHSTSMPQRPESYKLRHNNHLSLVLESLAGDESFMDVTLTAQGKAIKAHKSVLSAVSSYFKSVLKANPCQHPIIIMPRDIQFEELNNIIGYVYKGEMTVAAEDLPSLLRTAEVLQVTGLTPSDSSAMGSTSSSILGQIATRGTKPATPVVNQNSRASHSPTKSTNKKAPKFHSTPVSKEAQKNTSYGNDMSDKIDPLDFLNADMAYVKEEIESDNENFTDTVNESETTPDIDFHSPKVPIESKSSDSFVSHKSCPLSKKRKTSVDASSLPVDSGETEDNPDTLTDDSLVNQTALFVCPYCFQSHRPTDVLQAHLRLKHPSKPSFLCKCGKVTIRQSLYDQHLKTCDKS